MMRNKILLNLLLIVFFIIIIFISLRFIRLDPSIKSLFPFDEELELTVDLLQKSPVSDKIIIYIEVKEKNELQKAIDKVNEIISDSSLNLRNTLPDSDDITDLIEYAENNSLLLYPYESKENPFNKKIISKRLKNKSQYLLSIPFFNPSASFFNDPLMLGLETLNSVYENSKGKYTPQYGGIISEDGKSYIKILKSGFGNEDYKNIRKLKELDEKLLKVSGENNFKSFLFSTHLFFLESSEKIKIEVTIFFIITMILLLLIFYIFFRNIFILFLSFIPVLGGFAFAFLIISIVKPNFGGIALAFGATTSGISLDYIIHYLTKRNYYKTLKDVRKKIRFSLILGYITTIAAFVFLLFSRIESLNEISLFGILSISFVFIISWFVFQPSLPPSDLSSKINKINFPFLYNKKLFIIWFVFSLALTVFIPLIKFEENVSNLDMKHQELNSRKDLILEKFKESSDSIFLVFSDNDIDKILVKSLNALNVVKKEDGSLSFITPALLTPPAETIAKRKIYIKNSFNKDIFQNELSASDFNFDTFDSWLESIGEIENLKIDALPVFYKDQFDSMFVALKDKHYLMIHISKRESAEKIKSILEKSKIDFFILDIYNASKDGLITFEKKALILLSLSLLIIFLIIAIAYKNVIYGLTSILPSVLALLGCIMVSYFTNNGFNLMHFVSAVLLIGIGVDYGIFITSAFKEKYNEEEIGLTIQSILICTLTTLSGFGVLSLSSSYSIFSLGSSMFVGIIIAFLTTYIALPVILKKYRDRS